MKISIAQLISKPAPTSVMQELKGIDPLCEMELEDILDQCGPASFYLALNEHPMRVVFIKTLIESYLLPRCQDQKTRAFCAEITAALGGKLNAQQQTELAALRNLPGLLDVHSDDLLHMLACLHKDIGKVYWVACHAFKFFDGPVNRDRAKDAAAEILAEIELGESLL